MAVPEFDFLENVTLNLLSFNHPPNSGLSTSFMAVSEFDILPILTGNQSKVQVVSNKNGFFAIFFIRYVSRTYEKSGVAKKPNFRLKRAGSR
jgi:hypothetical protein